MKNFTCSIQLLLFSLLPLYSQLSAQAPVLSFTQLVGSGLSSPVDAVSPGDSSGRLFIVELTGTIKIFSNGILSANNFLNISTSISHGGEQGLLSLAFHPGYKTNRYFFIYYTNPAGSVTIARMRTKADNANEADPASQVVLLTIPKPYTNHNGGRLLFGPDGNLYFGTGDGGSGGDPNNFAQNGNSLLGKIIRINVDNFDTAPYYTIPANNPYINDANIKDEIFSIGLRNPFRWSFDRLNGDIWIGDVGQNLWEEIDRQPLTAAAGKNYGWHCYEGNAAYNTGGCMAADSFVKPVFVYPHNNTSGGFSVTGGCVYRGSTYPALYGWYICADYVSSNVWLLAPFGGGSYAAFQQTGLPGNITAFCENENGELYATSLTGKLYSVSTSTVQPTLILSFKGKPYTGFNELTWQYITGVAISTTEVQYSFDGVDFVPAGLANSNGNGPQSFSHVVNNYNSIYYRLRITTADGKTIYSTIIKLGSGNTSIVKLYPTLVNNGQLKLETTQPVQQLVIYAADGKKMFEKNFQHFLGNTIINLPVLSNGMYIARLFFENGTMNYKIMVSK